MGLWAFLKEIGEEMERDYGASSLTEKATAVVGGMIGASAGVVATVGTAGIKLLTEGADEAGRVMNEGVAVESGVEMGARLGKASAGLVKVAAVSVISAAAGQAYKNHNLPPGSRG